MREKRGRSHPLNARHWYLTSCEPHRVWLITALHSDGRFIIYGSHPETFCQESVHIVLKQKSGRESLLTPHRNHVCLFRYLPIPSLVKGSRVSRIWDLSALKGIGLLPTGLQDECCKGHGYQRDLDNCEKYKKDIMSFVLMEDSGFACVGGDSSKNGRFWPSIYHLSRAKHGYFSEAGIWRYVMGKEEDKHKITHEHVRR